MSDGTPGGTDAAMTDAIPDARPRSQIPSIDLLRLEESIASLIDAIRALSRDPSDSENRDKAMKLTVRARSALLGLRT